MRARVKQIKDRDIALGDVATVSARIFTDATGATEDRQMQVIGRSEPKPGHEVELIMQAYQFTGILRDRKHPADLYRKHRRAKGARHVC